MISDKYLFNLITVDFIAISATDFYDIKIDSKYTIYIYAVWIPLLVLLRVWLFHRKGHTFNITAYRPFIKSSNRNFKPIYRAATAIKLFCFSLFIQYHFFSLCSWKNAVIWCPSIYILTLLFIRYMFTCTTSYFLLIM